MEAQAHNSKDPKDPLATSWCQRDMSLSEVPCPCLSGSELFSWPQGRSTQDQAGGFNPSTRLADWIIRTFTSDQVSQTLAEKIRIKIHSEVKEVHKQFNSEQINSFHWNLTNSRRTSSSCEFWRDKQMDDWPLQNLISPLAGWPKKQNNQKKIFYWHPEI